MKRSHVAGALAAVVALTGAVLAADPAPENGPGWTGLTNPADVIAARVGLMVEVERLMRPIDSYTIGEPAANDDLRSTAMTIAQLLLALPHLFPPTTNLYDPAAATPMTIALPAIWQDFTTFYTLAAASSSAATTLAAMTDAEQLRTGARNLRASCDACHALYLRPYVPAEVSSEDLEFDFDSVLK